MAESSGPWPAPIGGTSGVPMTASLSRAIGGAGIGDGVIEDVTGGGLAVTLVTSGTVARLAPGAALLRGTHRYANSAAIDLPISTVTGSGNSRIDTLVLHYDPAQTTPALQITAKIITGTPAATPTAPALTRAEGSGWMIPLAQWTRATGAAAGNLVDLRTWLGPGGPVCASAAALPTDAPLGSTATLIDGSRWWRQLVSGSLQWISDSPIAACYLASDFVTPGSSGTWTSALSLTTEHTRGGMTRPSSYRIGVPFTGYYRIDSQCRVGIPAGAGDGFAYSQVRVNSAGNPAGGSLIAESYDYLPTRGFAGNVTLSAHRGSVLLTAGDYLEWFVSVPTGGGLNIGGGRVSTTISVQANG